MYDELKNHGVTASTPKNIMLGAGTVHKNFKFDKENKKWNFAESIIGATSGGNKLSIIPEVKTSYVRGVDYLGYRVFMDYVLLRKSTCIQMKRKMVAIREKCEAGNMMNYSEWCSINSYDGWLKPCNTFRLRQKYIVPLKPYTEKYYITNIKNQKGRKAA